MFFRHKVHQGHVEIHQISDLSVQAEVTEAQNDLITISSTSVPYIGSFVKLENSMLVVFLVSLLLIVLYIGYRTQTWWIHMLETAEKHQQHAITLQERLTEIDSVVKETDIAHRKQIELLQEQLNESMQMNATRSASYSGTHQSIPPL